MADTQKKITLEAIQELSRTVSDLLIEEQQLQDRELKRMSSLLHEAVTELSDCFAVMNDQLVAHSAQLQSRSKTDDEIENGQDMTPLVLSTQQVNSCVTRAVVSLQFEDILQQMINHSRQRAEETEKLLRYIRSSIEALESGQVSDTGVILDMLQKCRTKVASTREALNRSNPAQQQTMKKGDVTLF